MYDLDHTDLLASWVPQFDAMTRRNQTQATAAAVSKVKAIVTQVVTTFATESRKIDANPRLSAEAKAHDKGALALDAQVGLQPADFLVNVLGMEVRANAEQPFPAPKLSGNPVVDEMRAAEIRAVVSDLDAGDFQSLYLQAVMDGDAQFIAAVEAANFTVYPDMRISPALRAQALQSRLAAGADDAAVEARDLIGIHDALVAIVNDAKRFVGVDTVAQAAVGLLGAAGYTQPRGNGVTQAAA